MKNLNKKKNTILTEEEYYEKMGKIVKKASDDVVKLAKKDLQLSRLHKKSIFSSSF